MAACMAAIRHHVHEEYGPAENHADVHEADKDDEDEDDVLSDSAPFLPNGSPNLFWRAVDMELLRSQQQPHFVGLPPSFPLSSLDGSSGEDLAPCGRRTPCCPWAFRWGPGLPTFPIPLDGGARGAPPPFPVSLDGTREADTALCFSNPLWEWLCTLLSLGMMGLPRCRMMGLPRSSRES